MYLHAQLPSTHIEISVKNVTIQKKSVTVHNWWNFPRFMSDMVGNKRYVLPEIWSGIFTHAIE